MNTPLSDEFLTPNRILGEDFQERMSRFGLICENVHSNWDLSDRDENALRTANALLIKLKAELKDKTEVLDYYANQCWTLTADHNRRAKECLKRWSEK
jgi:hypothetical protein